MAKKIIFWSVVAIIIGVFVWLWIRYRNCKKEEGNACSGNLKTATGFTPIDLPPPGIQSKGIKCNFFTGKSCE